MFRISKAITPLAVCLLFASGTGAALGALATITPPSTPPSGMLNLPQWTTGSRLLKLGESVQFAFFLPQGADPGELKIFPRYLELAPSGADCAPANPTWLDSIPSTTIPLTFTNGQASVTYQPPSAGNYLARWRVGGESFYRYFSAITDDYIVVRFAGYPDTNQGNLHGTGIPVDLPIPVANFTSGDQLYQNFVNYHRYYGDTVVPQFPDTPSLTQEQRVAQYGADLTRIRGLVPDPNDLREARVEMWHQYDPGYTQTYATLGLVSHFGLQMANAGSWLGMPEFPYFASPNDIRKINQSDGGIVCHQWDFCGGWHFLGPQSWHQCLSNDDWNVAVACLRQGVKEAENLAQNSGRPAFFCPLYDGNPQVPFVHLHYRPFVAFELPKTYKLVYARSLDVADYYRRFYTVTPQTVFVSKTNHIFYDMHWHNLFAGRHELMTREQIPWLTRMSSVFGTRRNGYEAKDPLSYEYILLEDQKRSIRFERRSPNPIWWNDYTKQAQEMLPQGSMITWTATPDVDVIYVPATGSINPQARTQELVALPQWTTSGAALTTKMHMYTEATFTDYAIALWGIPTAFSSNPDPSRITTNAKRFVLAKNTDGEYHLILFFDLTPDLEIWVNIHTP